MRCSFLSCLDAIECEIYINVIADLCSHMREKLLNDIGMRRISTSFLLHGGR